MTTFNIIWDSRNLISCRFRNIFKLKLTLTL